MMNHILPRLLLLPVAAALVAVSCNKNVGEGPNVALKRQFDAIPPPRKRTASTSSKTRPAPAGNGTTTCRSRS